MKLKKFNFKVVKSTNDLAIKIIKNTNNKSGIVIAKNQKKGRGQYGNKWISYNGNLLVSIFFPIEQINISLKKLTTINCFLVKKLLSKFYKGKITIKKPNDLLINQKKISGILQEKIFKVNNSFIIIGIGINLIKSPKINKYPTTNLLEITGVKTDINNINLELIKIYEKYIPKLSKFNIDNINNI